MGEIAALLRVLASESREGRLQPPQVEELKSQLLSGNPDLIEQARAVLVPPPDEPRGRAQSFSSEVMPPPPPRRSSSGDELPGFDGRRWSGSPPRVRRLSVDSDDCGPPPGAPPTNARDDDDDDDDDDPIPPPAKAGPALFHLPPVPVSRLPPARPNEKEVNEPVEDGAYERYDRKEHDRENAVSPTRERRLTELRQDHSVNDDPPSRVGPGSRREKNESISLNTATGLKRAAVIMGVVPVLKRKCDFLLILNPEKNKFRMRWTEIDPDTMTFSFWKTRAARGASEPMETLRLEDVASLEWNVKDVTRGRRASLLGGGVRFTISMRQGTCTLCKAQNPLDARTWLNAIQELIVPMLEDSEASRDEIPGRTRHPTADEVCLYKVVANAEKQSGFLQKEGRHGRYKDRWCTLNTVTRVLTYWSKQPKDENTEPPKGRIDIAEVFTFEWNTKDLAHGRRRSFIKMDGVRFVVNYKALSKAPENWRANNPFEAYKWKDVLEKLHKECNVRPVQPPLNKPVLSLNSRPRGGSSPAPTPRALPLGHSAPATPTSKTSTSALSPMPSPSSASSPLIGLGLGTPPRSGTPSSTLHRKSEPGPNIPRALDAPLASPLRRPEHTLDRRPEHTLDRRPEHTLDRRPEHTLERAEAKDGFRGLPTRSSPAFPSAAPFPPSAFGPPPPPPLSLYPGPAPPFAATLPSSRPPAPSKPSPRAAATLTYDSRRPPGASASVRN